MAELAGAVGKVRKGDGKESIGRGQSRAERGGIVERGVSHSEDRGWRSWMLLPVLLCKRLQAARASARRAAGERADLQRAWQCQRERQQRAHTLDALQASGTNHSHDEGCCSGCWQG